MKRHSLGAPGCLITTPVTIFPRNETPQPGCSWMPDSNLGSASQANTNLEESDITARSSPVVTLAFLHASPEALMSIPKVQANTKRATRKRGKTAILTSTQYKSELEESLSERAKKVKRNFNQNDRPKKTTARKKKTAKGKKKVAVNISDSETSPEEEDAECLYCQQFYSKSTEGWVSCRFCCRWAHNFCAGIDSDDDDTVFL
ncbi:hypothetical protein QE152_g15413 [Popillia japonica]|uniref:Uncharacterized protein n=1 Tax=Popillia japonica TaxID=7064 RepID=A0AAW1L8B7_POPJA